MKRIILSSLVYQILIGLFITFSSYFFIWSEFGLLQHYAISKKLYAKGCELLMLQKEVEAIEKEITNWENDSFYLEKMAREQLGMGYKNEVVYLVAPEVSAKCNESLQGV